MGSTGSTERVRVFRRLSVTGESYRPVRRGSERLIGNDWRRVHKATKSDVIAGVWGAKSLTP